VILSEAWFCLEAANGTASLAVGVPAGLLHQHIAVAAEDRVRSGFFNRVGVAEAGDEGAVLQPPRQVVLVQGPRPVDQVRP
jgi:hypothetical protein